MVQLEQTARSSWLCRSEDRNHNDSWILSLRLLPQQIAEQTYNNSGTWEQEHSIQMERHKEVNSLGGCMHDGRAYSEVFSHEEGGL